MGYDFTAIENKWQKYWDEHKTFHAENDYSKPKFYALVEFPYPSGQGLHIGHPRPYTAMDDDVAAQGEKLMAREAGRLRMSLQAAGDTPRKIAFLHYPPVYPGASAKELVDVLQEFGVTECYYGHLHGKSIRYAVQGTVDGIAYRLISADGLAFCPYKIG